MNKSSIILFFKLFSVRNKFFTVRSLGLEGALEDSAFSQVSKLKSRKVKRLSINTVWSGHSLCTNLFHSLSFPDPH